MTRGETNDGLSKERLFAYHLFASRRLVCFAAAGEHPQGRRLDGKDIPNINPNLTTGIDLSRALPVAENRGQSLLGVQKNGPFDILGEVARAWLELPANPNGRSNREVLKPYWNGDDVTGRPRDKWFIDFPTRLSEAE